MWAVGAKSVLHTDSIIFPSCIVPVGTQHNTLIYGECGYAHSIHSELPNTLVQYFRGVRGPSASSSSSSPCCGDYIADYGVDGAAKSLSLVQSVCNLAWCVMRLSRFMIVNFPTENFILPRKHTHTLLHIHIHTQPLNNSNNHSLHKCNWWCAVAWTIMHNFGELCVYLYLMAYYKRLVDTPRDSDICCVFRIYLSKLKPHREAATRDRIVHNTPTTTTSCVGGRRICLSIPVRQTLGERDSK